MKKFINERTFIIWEILWFLVLVVALKTDDAVSPMLTIISIMILFISPFVISVITYDEEAELRKKEEKRKRKEEKKKKKEITKDEVIKKEEIEIKEEVNLDYIKEKKYNFKLPSKNIFSNNEEYFKLLNDKNMTTLTLPIGINERGNVEVQNFYDNPNLLIGGLTSTGKTTYIKSLINSLLLFNQPNDINFIIMDFAKVNYIEYESIPHVVDHIITNSKVAKRTFERLIEEKDIRINALNSIGVSNIKTYNERIEKDKMQKIILVMDELSEDIYDELNPYIKELSLIGHKVGIYIIAALNIDIINENIKDLGYDFAYRLSFRVPTKKHSDDLLNEGGAEKVKGFGNAVLQTSYNEVLTKLKVTNVSDQDIKKIANIWTQKNERTKK